MYHFNILGKLNIGLQMYKIIFLTNKYFTNYFITLVIIFSSKSKLHKLFIHKLPIIQ
jgi:hypothetical protein